MGMTLKEMADLVSGGVDLPEWFTAGKTTPKAHVRNVRLGRHPFGDKLTDIDGATCGNCRFQRVFDYHGQTYHKCTLNHNTHGPATDLRVKWRGCDKWEKGE